MSNQESEKSNKPRKPKSTVYVYCPNCSCPVLIDASKCKKCHKTFEPGELQAARAVQLSQSNAQSTPRDYGHSQSAPTQNNQFNIVIISLIFFLIFCCGIVLIFNREDPEGDRKWEREKMLDDAGYPKKGR